MEKRVKKPITMIQCSNPISLTSRKLFNIFLWKAIKTNVGLEKEVYTIDMDLLIKYTNIGRKNKNYIISLLDKTRELQTTLIEWDILGRKGSSQMIGSIEINDNNEVEYTLPYHLRKLIANSNMFEMIRLNITKLFKSKHSLALYENCVRFINVGSTGFISVEDWKKLLGVSNIPKYKTTYKINHYIIKSAMKEINEFSDIQITQEQKKKGNSITHIKFVIEKKEGIENAIDLEELKKQELDKQQNNTQWNDQLQKVREIKDLLN